MTKLTADILISLSGAALSLLMFYIPPFRRWMDGQIGDWKFAFMAGFLLVGAATYTAGWCKFDWACFQVEAPSMLLVWVSALIANQTAYKAVVQPVKKASIRSELEIQATAARLPR